MDKPLLTKPTNHLVSAFAVSWLGKEYSNTHRLSLNFAVLKVETGLSLAKRFAETFCLLQETSLTTENTFSSRTKPHSTILFTQLPL